MVMVEQLRQVEYGVPSSIDCMTFVSREWWTSPSIQGVKYEVKVIGQLFTGKSTEPSRGSCLPTSFEMAAWHLKHKNFRNRGGECSVLGAFNSSRGPPILPRRRIGSMSTHSRYNFGKTYESTGNRYYWNQPLLHMMFRCNPARMLNLANNSDIDLGIWDCCRKEPLEPDDIVASLNEGERTPILTFRYPRPNIGIDPENERGWIEFYSLDGIGVEDEELPEDEGHAVVITGWKKGPDGLEFLVNDPGPGAGMKERELKLEYIDTIDCGSKYWITEGALFDGRWSPVGLYEVYSNPEMLRINNGGRQQKLYLPEFTGGLREYDFHNKVEISNLIIL